MTVVLLQTLQIVEQLQIVKEIFTNKVQRAANLGT
jgi:hypothetical protein